MFRYVFSFPYLPHLASTLILHPPLHTQPQRPVSAPHIDFLSWGPWCVSPIPLYPARRSHPPSQLMSHPADIGFRHGPKRSALAQTSPRLSSCSSVPHAFFTILRVTQSIASVSPYRVTSDVQRSSRWPRVFTGLLRTRCLEAILANQNTVLDVNGKYCRRLYR